MPKKRKKSSRSRPARPAAPARFITGTQVRVKVGTTVPGFEDVPLGGWSGTITEVDRRSNPPTYEIEWNQRTLDAMHPVYRNRCERDGLELETMWLGENDIEPDSGELVPIEQPTQIVTRPLNLKDQDDRIRAIFALTSNDPLPDVDEETLRKYHRHLAEKLSFPFEGSYEEETGPFQVTLHRITVTALLDANVADNDAGFLCEVVEGEEKFVLPLSEVERASGPNRQLVEDYGYWFSNWRGGGDDGSPSQPLNLPAVLLRSAGMIGVLGAFYGATLGAAWTAIEGGAIAIKVAAIVVALLVGLFGTAFGPVFGPAQRNRGGSWLGGLTGAVLGAVIGGLLGALLIAFVGAFIGAVAGGVVGKLVRWKYDRPMFWFVVAGAMIGVIVQAGRADADAAWSGAWIGAVTGAILGPVVFFGGGMFLAGMMKNQP